jgi:hypothetical protein
MKKNELVDIIRTLVKEEVNNALPQLLMEVLAERLSENSAAILENRAATTQRPVKSKVEVSTEEPSVSVPVVQPQIMYSKNPILNQVLNETTGGIPTEATMQSSVDILQKMTPQQLNENKEVAAVANALKKDYRSLLKAMDKKISEKRR